MPSRKQRYKLVISRSTTQSNVKLKQTKLSDWLGSKSSSKLKEDFLDSDSSVQSCSSSSSSDFLNKAASAPPRKRSTRLEKLFSTTKSNGEDSQAIVLQLDEILTCDTPNCNYQTSFKVDLKRHKKIKHELKRLKCSDCDYVTHSERALKDHTSTHESRSLKCRLCPWTTTIPSLLNQHTKQTHERAERRQRGISRASEFGKKFKCSKCDFRAVAKQEIHLHNYSHETERKHKCSFPGCDYRSKTAWSLREHVKRHHGEAKKEFQCALCSKLFWTRPMLYAHIPSHTKEKVFSCSKCSFSTCYASNLAPHMRRHAKTSDKVTDARTTGECIGVLNSEESLRTSDTENSKTNSDLNLRGSASTLQSEATKTTLELEASENPKVNKKRRKKITNVPEKKHKCDQCDFTASYKCKIIRHAVVHRDPDDKIYSCSFADCDFKTNWEDYVKKHYRDMHKSAPDQMCPVEGCDFQTKWKDCLATHMKKVHVRRKRNHQCSMCRKAFYDSAVLKQHINTHTREDKYKCSLCDYVSTEISNVKSHGRKYHAGHQCEHIKVV